MEETQGDVIEEENEDGGGLLDEEGPDEDNDLEEKLEAEAN